MASMQLDIITSERILFSDKVDGVVVPGSEGELGVLPYHAPLLTVIQPGELRIVKDGEDDTSIAISGGFIEVISNKVVILADTAERSDEIDEARAEEAMHRAKQRLENRDSDLDLERGIAALRRSEFRVKVARRRRQRPSPSTTN